MPQSKPGQPLLTIENIFIVYNLITYAVFFAAYWVVNLTIAQDVIIFFGSEVLLFVGLMLYGVFSGLLVTKPRSKSRNSNKLKFFS